MQNIVIDKPYQFVAPRDNPLWSKLLAWYAPRFLRKSYGVVKTVAEGSEHLRQSLAAGHGIILAPNHCRDCDPLLLHQLVKETGSNLYLMASWHLFYGSKVKAWLLNRGGAFSIYREGMDRAALNAAIEIVEQAKRPLVLFPEGFVSRTNDRLNELLDGVSLIARSAAKKRAKVDAAKKVVVHPVAIRYTFEGDLQQTLDPLLTWIETRLTWQVRHELPLIERIRRVGHGLLTLKEVEYIGCPQTGTIAERLQRLTDHLLVPLEQEWLGGEREETINARAKRLRTAILPDMIKGEISEAERSRRWRQLADIYLAMQLHNYPPDYIRENPTKERLLETVERFEEDMTDVGKPHPPLVARLKVGEAIEVSPTRESRGEDPLLIRLRQDLSGMLGIQQNRGDPNGEAEKVNHEDTKALRPT